MERRWRRLWRRRPQLIHHHSPQPLHHRRVAGALCDLPAVLGPDTDVAARPRQRLNTLLRLIVRAGVVEGLYDEGALSFGTTICSFYRDSP